MPGAAAIVDSLPAITDERTQRARFNRRFRRRDDYYHLAGAERYKCLAAQRMTLHHLKSQWQRRRRSAARNADRDLTVVDQVDTAEIVKALKARLVHAIRGISRRFYHVAIDRKAFLR